MNDGTMPPTAPMPTTAAPAPMPAGCTCSCNECAMDKNCVACSHKMQEGGCDCAGCTCNMGQTEPVETPMAA